MELLNWQIDEEEIKKEIEGVYSPLKIILKTKDESGLVEEWVAHHKKITGASLIIFDNLSEENSVKEVYQNLESDAKFFEFSGNHNLIHDTSFFSGLYESVRKSCDYYVFLDTDEFLYLTDGAVIYNDFNDFLKVQGVRREDVFLGFWAISNGSNKHALYFNDIPSRFSSCLKGGKPIISSKAVVSGFINHNIQLMENNIGSELSVGGGVLVAHYNMFYKERRIEVNRRKILAHGFMNSEEEIDNALADGDFSRYSGNLKNYLQEIYRCVESLAGYGSDDTLVLGEKGVIFISGKEVKISDENSTNLMRKFVSRAKECWSDVMGK
jgi:hypothetical protein